MARAIDAEKVEAKLQYDIDHCAGYFNKAVLSMLLDYIRTVPTLTPPNEWVSVEERLPEPGERVLAANGSFVGEAYLASNGAWMRHDGFPWKVDCWMPMPDRRPPEGEV